MVNFVLHMIEMREEGYLGNALTTKCGPLCLRPWKDLALTTLLTQGLTGWYLRKLIKRQVFSLLLLSAHTAFSNF